MTLMDLRLDTNPPVPENELARLATVKDYELLDSKEDKELDELTRLTAKIFNSPIALITLLDEKRQWFKSNYGLSIHETKRTISFCQYTIMGDEVFIVPNAMEDERFQNNPLVTADPNIRFYAGAPLINSEGIKIGSLAVIDRLPRQFDQNQKKSLELLARQVVIFFDLHKKKKVLEKEKANLEQEVHKRTKVIEDKLQELKLQDEKIKIANNDLTTFIYKASHDIQGPLKTMLGITDLALSEVNDDNIKMYLELLQQTENRLDSSLQKLLRVVELKDKEVEVRDIDWKEMVNSAIKEALNRSEKKELDVSIECNAPDNIKSDPIMLEAMLEEIVHNSLQYYQEKPSLSINIERNNNETIVNIEDKGIGIKDKDKDKVTNMFFKSGHSKGSGLGLYLVKTILDKLGGNLNITTVKNQGTKVSISLPDIKKEVLM